MNEKLKTFWLVIGRSCSGKDTLVDNLVYVHPTWSRVISKTTKSPRLKKEKYIFTNEAEYQKDLAEGKIIAHSFYDGAHYWATYEQVEAADFFVIDIPGLIEFKEKYKGNKTICTMGLIIKPEEAQKRMRIRGDSEDVIQEKLINDDEAFADMRKYVDFLMDTEDLDEEDMVILAEDIIYAYERDE